MNIKAYLGLEDKMTPALSKAEKQAIANIKAYEDMDKQVKFLEKQLDMLSEAGLDNTETFYNLTDAWDKARDMAKQYAEGTLQAQDAEDKLTQTATELNQELELLGKAWRVLNQVIQEANQWMQESNQQFNAEFTSAIKMHNVLGATKEEVQSMYDYAGALQKVGVVGDEAVISGMSELSMYTETVDQVRRLTPLMLDFAVAENGVNTNMSNVTSSAGMLGRALNGSATMLVRQGVLTQDQAKYLDNLATKEDKVAYLVDVLSKKVQGANEVLAQTAEGGIMQANNKMSDMQELLGSKIIPYFSQWQQTIAEALTPAVQFLADNIEWIMPIFITLIGTIGALIIGTTIWSMVNYVQLHPALAKTLLLTLKIIAIVLILIGVIYLIKVAAEKVTGKTISFMGLIAGMVSVLGAIIYNVVAATWNSVAELVDFVLKIVLGAIDVIVTALWGVAWVINGIAKLFDMVFGSNIAQYTQSVLDGLKSTKDSIEKTMSKDIMPRMDYMNVGDAARAGYNWGSKFSEGISSGAGSTLDKLMNGLDSVMGEDGAGGSAIKTTTNDNLLSDEDIQLLLDVATRDYKLNYQQITPQITLTFGDIHETADVDGIIENLTTQIEESYQYNLQEVMA